MKETNKVTKMVVIAMLSAVSYVLMLFQFPLLPAAPFLQVDFGDIPALIGGIIFGPTAGVFIVFLRNVLHALISGTTTLGIGEAANFLAGTLYIVPIAYMYRKSPTIKALLVGLVSGTLMMTVGMAVSNYFIFIPAYARFLHFETPDGFIVAAIIPFNLLKGLIVSGVAVVLFQSMKVWLHQKINIQKA